MTILFTHPYYRALPDAVTQTVSQLCRSLTSDDRAVIVLCLRGSGEVDPGIELWEVPSLGLRVEARWTRPILQIWFLVAALYLVVARHRKLNCTVTIDTPSGIGLAGVIGRRISRGRMKHICWVIDLVADQIDELDYQGPYKALHGARRALSEYPYRRCDSVVTLGYCMQERFFAKGISNVAVIPQWQDRTEVYPRDSDDAKARMGLGGRGLVVLYSGNADIRHPLDVVLDVAEQLGREIVFLLVGRSQVLRDLEMNAKRRGLVNVLRRDPSPREELSDLLSAGDVHLVSLAPKATGTCVPSKAYSAMAVARPVIFLGSDRSQVGRDVLASDGGSVLDPDDAAGFSEAIRRLHDHPARRREQGENGYSFFLQYRELAQVAAQWEGLFADLTGGRATRPSAVRLSS